MIIFNDQRINEIHFPKEQYCKLIEHCLRKLNGGYLAEETKEQQAYGLIGGKIFKQVLLIGMVVPLYKNFRKDRSIKKHMDNIVSKYAIPAKTPIEERGWIASPSETIGVLKMLQQENLQLVGTYHMHHLLSWNGDGERDKPTELDRNLAKDTELFMFIIGMINPQKPIIRTYYEGCVNQEIQVIIN